MDRNSEMIAKTNECPVKPDRKKIIVQALEDYERPLTRYALRLLGSHSKLESARDAVQHTFLKLCEQDIEPLQGRIGPWLYRVCRNGIIDQLRSHRGKTESWPEPFQVEDPHSGPVEKAQITEFSHRLALLIGQLTGNEREVIELWSQGLNHAEISNVLDKSRESIRGALHRGLNKLKQHPEVVQWLQRATSHPGHETSSGRSKSPLANKRPQQTNLKPR